MLETCSDLMRRAYDAEFITVRDGNISVAWHDRDHFWITPSGIRKPDLQPNMWKKIDKATGKSLEYTDISANLYPSGELPLHWGLQKNLPHNEECRVVVHLHPTYTVAAMHRGLVLEDLVNHFPELGRLSYGPIINVGRTLITGSPLSLKASWIRCCASNLDVM